MDARKEFCIYVRDRIITKLVDAEEYELLCFALCGIDLGLRQSDTLRLEWNQVDFDNRIIRNVYQTKLSNQKEKPVFFDYPMSNDLLYFLQIWCVKSVDEDLIFPNIKKYRSVERIGELIGDNYLHANELRSMCIALKSV